MCFQRGRALSCKHISAPIPDTILSYGNAHKRMHIHEILLTSHSQPQTSAALDDRHELFGRRLRSLYRCLVGGCSQSR